MLGQQNVTISTSSSTTSQPASAVELSLYLVLDRSGSMSWITEVVQSTTRKCQNYTEDNCSEYPPENDEAVQRRNLESKPRCDNAGNVLFGERGRHRHLHGRLHGPGQW